jgi:uncharacterized damage-inducible protein DinB
MDLLDRLMEHDKWATTTLLTLCGNLTDTQLDQSFDVGHQTMRATFEHLIFNIEAWSASMFGEPLNVQHDDQSVPALTARHERAYDRFATFARHIRDDQRFDDTFTDNWDAPQTYGAAILHVILHNEGHRLELLHILNRLNVPNLPEIDHALWDFVRRGLFVSPDEAG